jgi:hypothetical protein
VDRPRRRRIHPAQASLKGGGPEENPLPFRRAAILSVIRPSEG